MAAGLVWLDRSRVLLQRRSPTATHGAGRLELPGGKVELGEAPAAALARELVEEWGSRADDLVVGSVAEVLHHVYSPPGPEVVLLVYHVDARTVDGGSWAAGGWREALTVQGGARAEAYGLAELPVDEFLAADREFARALAAGRVRPPGT